MYSAGLRVSEAVGINDGDLDLTEGLVRIRGKGRRERLAQVKRQRWIMLDQPPAVRQVLSRLQRLIREAARNREAKRLADLEHAIASVAGGHTAGEMALLECLGEAGDSQLMKRLGMLPNRRSTGQSLEVRLTGMVIFGPPHQAGIEVASLECGSTLHSSTSTEP
jgi:integrase